MREYQPTPDFYNDYIAHHGIKGQKWGVRNGPPYPLNSSVSTGKSIKKDTVYGSQPPKKDSISKAVSKGKISVDNSVSGITWISGKFEHNGSKLSVAGAGDESSKIDSDVIKEVADKVLRNRNDIEKACKDAIMDDSFYYENWGKPLGLSEKQFRDGLELKSVYIPNRDYSKYGVEVSIWEKDPNMNLLGGHSLDIEDVDLNNPKRKPKYVIMNG